MTVDPVTAAFLSGLILGNRPMPTPELVEDLRERKPSFYEVVDIDLSTARTDEEYKKAGNFIWVDNQYGVGKATIRLNEPDKEKLDLLRQKFISGPFYRFFITNLAGRGKLRLIISRGYSFASEPIESVTTAELAARLGSIVTFDRRGDVMDMEDFSRGLSRWSTTGTFSGTVVQKGGYGDFSGFVGRWQAPVASNNYAYGSYESYFGSGGAYGLEVAIDPAGSAGIIDIIFSLFDGSSRHRGGVRIDRENSKVQYRDATGAWVDVWTALAFPVAAHQFLRFKLVLDLATGEYSRLLFNHLSSFLGGIAYQTSDSDAFPGTKVEIYCYGNGVTTTETDVEYVIITQSEP